MKKVIIISTAFSLACAALVGFLIYPLLKGINEQSQKVLSLKENLLGVEARGQTLPQLRGEFSVFEPGLKEIDALFVDSGAPIEFIEFLEGMALQDRLRVEIAPGGLQKGEADAWTFMAFQIGLAGTFSNTQRFLEKLQTGPYLIDVQSLNASRLSQEDIKGGRCDTCSLGDVSTTLSLRVAAR